MRTLPISSKLIFQFVFSLLAFTIKAQIPAQGAQVNFTQVYFEDKFIKDAVLYKIQVYQDSSAQNLVFAAESKLPAFESKGLSWATKYRWKVSALDAVGKNLYDSDFYTFSIGKKVASVNEDDTKFEVHYNNTAKHAGGLVMLDYARGIFTRDGERLWTAPLIPGLITEKRQVRDLKLSKDKTITLIAGNIPIEIDFEGNVLWTAPHPFVFLNDTITYHHDFRKLNNGNYMVLAHKKAARRIIDNSRKDTLRADMNMFIRNDTLYKRTFQSMLFEFDKNGKVIWYWDSNAYISDEDLNYKITESSFPSFGTHANAFSVSSDNSKVYVGFRDLNRIVRIDRKTKKVEYSYGEKYPSGDAKIGAGLIVGQHDATITDRGTILVLNNNNDIRKGNEVGTLLELRDMPKPKEELVAWSFSLKFDTLTDGKTTAAGNVVEMKNSNLLVCAGIMPRLFEVNKSKEVVWDAFVYGRQNTQDKWVLFPQYRIGFTPQLYFYHFLVKQQAADKSNKKNTITIYNTGNTADSYTLKLPSQKGKELVVSTTLQLSPGEEVTVVLPKTVTNSKIKQLIIYSNHSRFTTKTINL